VPYVHRKYLLARTPVCTGDPLLGTVVTRNKIEPPVHRTGGSRSQWNPRCRMFCFYLLFPPFGTLFALPRTLSTLCQTIARKTFLILFISGNYTFVSYQYTAKHFARALWTFKSGYKTVLPWYGSLGLSHAPCYILSLLWDLQYAFYWEKAH